MVSGKHHKNSERWKYRMDLSLRGIIFYGLCLALLLAWTFTLGVLAGRGFLSQGMETITALKERIAKMEARINSNHTAAELSSIEKMDQPPELAFYEKLATKEQGLAKEVSSETKRPSRSKTTREVALSLPKRGPQFTIQVASLESRSKATQLVKRLAKRGYPAYVHKATVKGRIFYRVRCGTFHTRAEARELSERLKVKEGVRGLIVTVED